MSNWLFGIFGKIFFHLHLRYFGFNSRIVEFVSSYFGFNGGIVELVSSHHVSDSECNQCGILLASATSGASLLHV